MRIAVQIRVPPAPLALKYILSGHPMLWLFSHTLPRKEPRRVNHFQTSVAGLLPEMKARLRTLVEQESPTEDPAGVNAAAGLVSRWARDLGAVVSHPPGSPPSGGVLSTSDDSSASPHIGEMLELRFGDHTRPERPILLLGHLDTVWPRGTLVAMPWREQDGRLFGPGVLDMKAGIVMALTALAIRTHHERPVTLLLNPDEETGSLTSRPTTERLARASAAVLVLEPAQGFALKTARKGVGHFILEVTGVAAHAGVDFAAGHSAIRELAHQIEVVSELTDLARGLTVNCGVITGGTRSNVVAERASVEIDVRIPRAADATDLEHQLRSLTPRDPACTLHLAGGINRPPMERSPATVRLFEHARTLAAGLGFQLDEAATGGGSDGNFTAALGVPTLDGMGAVGEGAHAAHESILIEHLVPRTALLAAMLDHLDVGWRSAVAAASVPG